MDQTTKFLAASLASMEFDALPERAVHETKRRVIDSIACAAGAFSYPLSATMRRVAGGQTAGGARVWFTGAPGPVDLAGLANGTMVRYLDLSDTILSKAAGHPSDMIPALVALAEAAGADGQSLILAIAAAYAVYGGLCDAVAFQKRAVDQSTAAALGAAAGASRLLGLDATSTGQALALALGANVNLYNVRQGALSDWKAIAGPNAARNGIFAAQMAAEGLTGPSAVFDGASGLKEIVGAFDVAFEPARIVNTHLKAYPVCYHGQSAVDAATSLAGRIPAGTIRSVRVETYETAFLAMANDPSRWAPENRETADHAIPFVVGTVLMTGQLRPEDYGSERLGDPALRDFMQRIEVTASEHFTARYPAEARTRITLVDADGQTVTGETIQPKGHVDNPLSDAELEAKFDALWPAGFGQEAKTALIDAVWHLDRLGNTRALVDRISGLA